MFVSNLKSNTKKKKVQTKTTIFTLKLQIVNRQKKKDLFVFFLMLHFKHNTFTENSKVIINVEIIIIIIAIHIYFWSL